MWGRLLALILMLSASSALAETWEGTVVSVADGDTLTVLVQQRQQKVRLSGVDCPERAQPFGQVAKQYTATQAFGQQVSVITTAKDRYGRWIGVVVLQDGRVLNHSLLDEGLCHHYRIYSKDPVLATLEAGAQAAKRGLWQEANPVPPWEFRKKPKVK